MESSDSQDLHRTIFDQAREAIEVAYEKARKKRLRNPVVLVLDLRDDTARGILESFGGGQKADDQCAEAERRRVLPLCYVHLAGDDAAKLLAQVPGIPDIADQLRDTVPAGFFTVLLAGGGPVRWC